MRTVLAFALLLVTVAACTDGTPPAGEPTSTPATATTSDPDPREPTIESIRYAPDHPSQFGQLYLPDEPRSTLVVLIHGGFWYAQYGLESVQPLARDLADGGYPVWSIEYRRVGEHAGGWPGTFEDVAMAIDHVIQLPVAPSRIVVVGHSAGGHLALWAAARQRLPDGRVGSQPAVVPDQVVGLAAVSDLRSAARQGLGADAVDKLLGGAPSEVPERVRVAAPIASLPLGVPQLLVHGRQDRLVPVEMSEQYAQQARAAGDQVQLEIVDGGHFDMIDPDHAAWDTVLAFLEG
ncbi:MAG: alpha/beta hydrolase [Nitriliruptorales bacterium]|nr:alpha/beta hydrolase [Nitriliruptorales bacterium]